MKRTIRAFDSTRTPFGFICAWKHCDVGRSYSLIASQLIPMNTSLEKSGCGNSNTYRGCFPDDSPHSRTKALLTRKFGSSDRPDPFARRPTSKCDPYGQDGKPLTLDEAKTLLPTVEPEWEILLLAGGSNDEQMGNAVETHSGVAKDCDDDNASVPFGIARNFWHDDYMSGAQFLNHVAAVAQINAQHYPYKVVFDRKLQSRTKSWKICTRVVCRTHVLQGLSHHDFYLATLIDIEIQRPEVKNLVIQ